LNDAGKIEVSFQGNATEASVFGECEGLFEQVNDAFIGIDTPSIG
jgi:hypothetical protein